MSQEIPYGCWKSPITARLVAEGSVSFSEPEIYRNSIYFIESRPSEKGRNTIIKFSDKGDFKEILPPEYSAKSRVHEYGGGSLSNIRFAGGTGWDNTQLWMGELNRNSRITSQVKIAGGEEESIIQPRWSPDGIPHFVSEPTSQSFSSFNLRIRCSGC